jgi:large subunit ribosomal protein L3
MPKTMGILGKKLGMTRVYDEMGIAIPVTVVETGPCTVVQVKTVATDGYNAIQVGFAEKKLAKVTKPMAGHFKKAGDTCFYYVREFWVETPEEFEVGQELSADTVLKAGDLVDVQGISKGKGFQGVIKRYGFKGGGAAHGSGFHRAPGSIGCSAWPAKVVKGKKMPGRMGNDTVLKKNTTVVDVRSDDNVVLLKGPVPGAKNGLLKIFSK